MSGVRDQVRAALLLVFGAVLTLAAVPTPGSDLSDRNMSSDFVVEGLAPWTGLMVRIGISRDDDAARQHLAEAGGLINRARRTTLGPFLPAMRFFGIEQRWRMFGMIDPRVGRLEVHGRRGDGDWDPLFVQNDPNAAWHRGLFGHSRMRALQSEFGRRKGRDRWRPFAGWVGRLALDEHPELVAVRVRMVDMQIPPPERLARTGELTAREAYWEQVVTR